MTRAMTLLALLLPAVAGAEIQAGTVELGGSGRLGVSSATSRVGSAGTVETRTFGVQASALQYLTPHLGVGAELGLLKTIHQEGGAQTTVTTTSVAPKLGVAWPTPGHTAAYGEALVGWAEDKSGGARATGLTWGLGAGVKFFLASAFSVDLGLRYRGARLQAGGGGAVTRLGDLFVGLGLSGYVDAR